MSGIEVVGLVLGAFPLLVSALEHYRESAEVLSNWLAFRRKYQKVKHDLEWLRFSYTQNLKELLLPLICDEDEVEALMSDPLGTLWTEPELEHKLKERLGGAYIHYLRAVEDVNEVMEGWKHELGLDKLDVKASKGKINFQLFRVKFAFSQSNRDELFKEFKEYNSRLEEILRQGDRLQQISTATKAHPKSISKSFKLIRRRATTLYNLLAKAWTCQCKSLHHAHLGLDNQTPETTPTKFHVVFAYSPDIVHQHRPWNIKKTSIVVVEDEIASDRATSFTVATGNIKRVTIAERASGNLITSSMSSHIQPLPTLCLPDKNVGKVLEIKDLCSTLASTASDIDCFGGLQDGEECYQVHSGSQIKSNDRTELLPLKHLLQEHAETKLHRRQRYDLAYAIALANVQLYSTPWLSKHLGKDSIILSKIVATTKPSINNQPLLVQDFSNTNEASWYIDKNEFLTRLGIVLLELCFGKTIESSSSMTAIRSELGLAPGLHSPRLDRFAALEWSQQVLDETGSQYAAAVDWCLKIGQTRIETDEEWQFKAYENVVLPLQECCKLLR